MRQFIDHLRSLNFYVCGVFLIDAQFLIDASKFASGVLSALATMVNLEVCNLSTNEQHYYLLSHVFHVILLFIDFIIIIICCSFLLLYDKCNASMLLLYISRAVAFLCKATGILVAVMPIGINVCVMVHICLGCVFAPIGGFLLSHVDRRGPRPAVIDRCFVKHLHWAPLLETAVLVITRGPTWATTSCYRSVFCETPALGSSCYHTWTDVGHDQLLSISVL